jgi:hypothetical protein
MTFLKKSDGLGYRTSELGETIVQTYADDMILVSDSKENLQKLVNRPLFFSTSLTSNITRTNVKFSDSMKEKMIRIYLLME